jgi:hypothetical protein
MRIFSSFSRYIMHDIRQLLHQRHLLQVEDVEEFDGRMEMQLVRQLVVYD